MQPRVLFRTHYQVDEPAIMELLIKLCTSPVQSAYDETVARRLAQELQRRGKELNVDAAGYAVDLARGLSLVNDQNVWTEKGHLVGLLSQIVNGSWEDESALNLRERVLHFRLFLEADGAVILYIARHLIEHKRFPVSESDWNDSAKELFVQIYTECLKLAGTIADRVALRTDIDRIRSSGYKRSSGRHKMYIHLQSLYRLGFVECIPMSKKRHYLLPEPGGAKPLEILMEEIPDLYALETVIKERRIVDVAARVFALADSSAGIARDADEFLRLIVPIYRQVMATGVPLCPLATLIEAVQINLLIGERELLPYSMALSLLQAAQKKHLRDVRFHVDRQGMPAFLKLSDGLMAADSAALG